MRLCVLALMTFLASCRPLASTPADSPDAGELTRKLTAQLERAAADWNRGDLDAFMADYARDTTTTFVAGGHVRRGVNYIRDRYAPSFAPGAQRDSLRFEEIEARPLGPGYALVTARFLLFRDGRTTASGPFTLVMQEQQDGWRILHDHTSSDPR